MFGPYRTIEKVGAGATAVVYRAVHTGTGQMVALKVILFNQSNAKLSRRLKKLFATEAALAMKVKHPNIVSIFEADIEEKFAYIAMEFVSGVALREHCSFDKLLPAHKVVEIMFKCAMALDFSARMGVVHRDIKPDNIMLGDGDVVKVTDFGLALDMKKKSDADSTFIMGVGSPAYMSPEQIKDYPLNGQTDLYSLGTVMFELLTGRQPFRAKNRASLMYKIINMDAEAVSTLNPSVPDSLDPIVKRTLEKDLYTRYRTGAQFAQDLSSAKFQILDDADSVRLTRRFRVLRQNAAFTDFENDEIWEILRISHWRVVHESRPLMVEGEEGGNFGVVIDGEVEVSLKGKQLAVYGAGQVIGELAFLSPERARRNATVVAMVDTTYLEGERGGLCAGQRGMPVPFQATRRRHADAPDRGSQREADRECRHGPHQHPRRDGVRLRPRPDGGGVPLGRRRGTARAVADLSTCCADRATPGASAGASERRPDRTAVARDRRTGRVAGRARQAAADDGHPVRIGRRSASGRGPQALTSG